MNNKDKKCITCGCGMNTTEKDMAKMFKSDYDNHNIVRWVYRLNKRAGWRFARENSFKKILPILNKRKHHGADYYHISEFRIS